MVKDGAKEVLTLSVLGQNKSAMKVNLRQKLSPQLILTPQLQQAIRLLQLSALEIEQELMLAAEQNPFLEFDNSPDEEQIDPILEYSHTASSAKLAKIDAEDLEGYSYLSREETLLEYLIQQITTLQIDGNVQKILYYLAGCIDERGYLRESREELRSDLESLNLNLFATELNHALEQALYQLKRLDPPGVGAESLSECLLLQLDSLEGRDERVIKAARDITSYYLEDLAKNNLDKIRQKLRQHDSFLLGAIQLMKTLNPSPGLQYANDPNEIITPDVFIKKSNRRWVAFLNPNNQPNVRVRSEYLDAVKGMKSTPDTLPFLEKLNEAKVLVKSVKQRGETILKVAQAIIEKQQAFFERGDLAMQPLLLKEIAEAVGLHESTISRVTSQKYMQSARGTFAFKYFFGGQIGHNAGENVSSKAIQTLIKQIIQNEIPTKPLSDGAISTLLNNEGYRIARRTIVKYREILRIPAIHSRKRMDANL